MMFNIKIPSKKDVFEKRCLTRVDFNSSFSEGRIKNDLRIKESLPLIRWLKENRAKVILLMHIEENSGEIPRLDDFFESFKNDFFSEEERKNIFFADGIINEKAKEMAKHLLSGQILLLDNLRLARQEKENDTEFAKELSSLGDIYINEAFSDSHRDHASITGVPKFIPKFCGFNFKNEVENLSKMFNPPRPFFIFMGGQKLSSKTRLIKNFLNKADNIFLGGVMALEFYAAKGIIAGRNALDAESVNIIKESFLSDEKIIIPDKFIVLRNGKEINLKISEIQNEDLVYDVSSDFFDGAREKLKESKTILWNGPMGYIEEGFTEGTKKLIEIFSETKAENIVAGGGETVDFINSSGAQGFFSFISSGGGAMLEFLAEETLPGIEALKISQ